MVCGTPIGNLEDLTPRVAAALKGADVILAEDTRRARKLLNHLGVRVRMISFNDHNAAARIPQVMSMLGSGLDVALVSDAGMPGVSDPGAALVERAHASGAQVIVLPGPSAVTTALAWSGLEIREFTFAGFPPRKSGERRRYLRKLSQEGRIVVIFEAVHRIDKTLADVEAELGPVPVIITREMTKIHEEMLRGTPGELVVRLREQNRLRGEFTVILDLRPKKEHRP
ncbi:MAG: 16S rRNA (cytidine(1402)-2'-O)-methyltransferase [Bacillota bacterium]